MEKEGKEEEEEEEENKGGAVNESSAQQNNIVQYFINYSSNSSEVRVPRHYFHPFLPLPEGTDHAVLFPLAFPIPLPFLFLCAPFSTTPSLLLLSPFFTLLPLNIFPTSFSPSPFGQGTRRAQYPIEHNGEFTSVRPNVYLNVHWNIGRNVRLSDRPCV